MLVDLRPSAVDVHWRQADPQVDYDIFTPFGSTIASGHLRPAGAVAEDGTHELAASNGKYPARGPGHFAEAISLNP